MGELQDKVNSEIIEQLEKQVAELEQIMSQTRIIETQPKWKSKVFWISVLPIVFLLGDTYGIWDVIGMPKTSFAQLLTSIGSLLTVLGVWNSPDKKTEF